ncbi:MAG: hypothetical protein QXD48_02300 [Candidatus Aenigmatarchaeota archaeon]
MGIFTPYVYKSKNGQKFWLHAKTNRKVTLYYFSKDPTNAINSLPKGFEVIENQKTGLPFLKKKEGGGIFSFLKKSDKKEKQTSDKDVKNN